MIYADDDQLHIVFYPNDSESVHVSNRHQKCNGVQRHDNTSYIWVCYHMLTNHTL